MRILILLSLLLVGCKCNQKIPLKIGDIVTTKLDDKKFIVDTITPCDKPELKVCDSSGNCKWRNYDVFQKVGTNPVKTQASLEKVLGYEKELKAKERTILNLQNSKRVLQLKLENKQEVNFICYSKGKFSEETIIEMEDFAIYYTGNEFKSISEFDEDTKLYLTKVTCPAEFKISVTFRKKLERFGVYKFVKHLVKQKDCEVRK